MRRRAVWWLLALAALLGAVLWVMRPQEPVGPAPLGHAGPAATPPAPDTAARRRPTPSGPYDHDPFRTLPREEMRSFTAFVVSFDGSDDDDGDGRPDSLRVPQWVAYELRRLATPPRRRPRPSQWATDPDLFRRGLAANDASYRFPAAVRARQPNGYVRGHLAMKWHAERQGPEAGRQTHTVLNAVPQRADFNRGIWEDLECRTGAWADQYGQVWVITGPVFARRAPRAWLGETARGERRVAIPGALFKVVVRRTDEGDGLAVLAWIYPQEDPAYRQPPWDHRRFLTSVDEVEAQTGLDFFSALPAAAQRDLEAGVAEQLWPVAAGLGAGCRQD